MEVLFNNNFKFHHKNSASPSLCLYSKNIGSTDDNPGIQNILNTLNYNEILIDSIFDTYLITNVNNDTDNYNKYDNKNIITIIFTPDCDEPYYINWINNENINLIVKYKNYIINILQNKLLNEYLIKSKCIFSYYRYCRENYPLDYSKNSLEIIEYIKSEYDKDKAKDNKEPKYIMDFFNYIKFRIENCKDKKSKQNILKEYDDKTYFMSSIEDKIKYSINRYLGIKNDDDDEEEN